MASTFFGLDIAQSGMQAYQTALNTTAHNIANAGTTGYSRQTANTKASNPLRAFNSYGMIGTGVAVTDITRQRSEYYDKKYQISTATASEYSTKAYYLDCVGSFLYSKDSDTAAITNGLDNFFAKLTNAQTNAADTTLRKEVSEYGTTFTTYVKDAANKLQGLQQEANEEIMTSVNQINSLADRIISLTDQINTLEVYGSTANDLRDQRGVLVDELSKFANVECKETEPANGVGYNQYQIFINGTMLVDSTKANHLVLSQRENKDNINDIAGMYDITWESGQAFHPHNTNLGGKLQALFELRDGNNCANFGGKIANVTEADDGKMTVTLKDTNVNSLAALNIPDSKGALEVNGFRYEYDSFKVDVQADGSYVYTFSLKDNISTEQKGVLNHVYEAGGSAQIGDSISYKGIPYYMAQLNEFVRTFSENFNEVHNKGYDANGNAGLDFFNATQTTDGKNYNFSEKGDGYDASFSSIATMGADGYYVGSYYHMTCMNFNVNEKIQGNTDLLAFSSDPTAGGDQNLNLVDLTAVKNNSNMFAHGAPDSFLQSLTSAVGVDGAAATSLSKSQDNILKAIDNRRLSISGVDKDEEAADLVKFQNLLFNQYKVLSVMDEVYDKLINGTAV